MKTEVMDNTALTLEVSMIALEAVRPSPVNPRSFEGKDAAIAELAENIARVGLIQPITVRPVVGKKVKYEIVAGERRFRAYQVLAAKRPELFAGQAKPGIPAFVRKITDAEALELTVVENLQREDLSPLEEASGIATLVDRGMTHEEIADKLARPVGWVAKRAKLRDLASKWKQAIADPESPFSTWTAGHLELVAKFTLAVQVMIIEEIQASYPYNQNPIRFMTIKDLKEWLGKYQFRLSTAPWGTSAYVVPEAVSASVPCNVCDRRSSVQPNLFENPAAAVKNDQCLDKACFAIKLEAFLGEKLKGLRAVYSRVLCWRGDGYQVLHENSNLKKELLDRQYEYRETVQADSEALPALVIDGKGVGLVLWVKLHDWAKKQANSTPVDAEGNPLPKPLSERRESLQKRRNKALLERALELVEKEEEKPERTLRLDDMQILRFVTKSALPKNPLRLPKSRKFTQYIEAGDDSSQEQRPLLIQLMCRALNNLHTEIQGDLNFNCNPDSAELAYWLMGLDVEEARREIEAEIPEPKAWASLNEDGTPKRKAG